MRKIKEVLRHKWGLGLSHREVAQSVGVSVGAVWLVVHRAAGAGLDWVTAEGMDDADLEARIYGRDGLPDRVRPMPDCARIDLERRRVGVTLQLLYLEYLEQSSCRRLPVPLLPPSRTPKQTPTGPAAVAGISPGLNFCGEPSRSTSSAKGAAATCA